MENSHPSGGVPIQAWIEISVARLLGRLPVYPDIDFPGLLKPENEKVLSIDRKFATKCYLTGPLGHSQASYSHPARTDLPNAIFLVSQERDTLGISQG